MGIDEEEIQESGYSTKITPEQISIDDIRATIQNQISTFTEELMPTLELAPKTEHLLTEYLDQLMADDTKIIANPGSIGEYNPFDNSLTVGAEIVAYYSNHFLEVFNELGIQISESDLIKISIEHIINHEIGHMIDFAYRFSQEQTVFSTPARLIRPETVPKSTQLSAVRNVLDHYNSDPAADHFFGQVETERFAEGIGLLFTTKTLIGIAGVDPDQQPELIEHIYSMRQAEAQPIEDALSETNYTLGNFFDLLKAREKNYLDLGYANPYTPDQIKQILHFTKILG